jgi:surface protein
MSGMFSSATSFNQNIGAWDVSKVTTMVSMFQSNTAFNNSGSSDINNWRPVSCSNFTSMFESAGAFNQPIGGWEIGTGRQVPDINMSSMFAYNTVFNRDISAWDTSKVTNMYFMFGGSLPSAFNQPIGTWDVSNVTNMALMFTNAANFNQPLGSWDVSKVTNMNRMFENCTAFNQDIGNWNVGNVTSFGSTFLNTSTYSYLHTIYDGWINNKLQPNITIGFGTNNYSASAAEGKALLERPYITGTITGYSDASGRIAITCSVNHNVVEGNRIFISGSSQAAVNGVQRVFATSSATMLTLDTLGYDPTATGGTVITGYGWTITDGNPVP